ncbi:MAG: hypothetical protein MRZ79_01740 [Bacteroidia bacterium]|nr:hypothetical protein [Bacteroidia bacterium]
MKNKNTLVWIIIVVIALTFLVYSFFSSTFFSVNYSSTKESSRMTKIIEERMSYNKMDKIISEFYDESEKDFSLKISFGDSIIKNDPSLNHTEVALLNFLVGKEYYNAGLSEEAIIMFDKSYSLEPSPPVQAYKAAALAKMRDFDQAEKILRELALEHKYYFWHLGNLYEMIGDLENASKYYKYFSESDFRLADPAFREKALNRIAELSKEAPQLLDEVVFL